MSTSAITDQGESLESLRARLKEFIDGEVIPAEPQILAEEEDWFAPTLMRLKETAKERGLWTLGHPREIGGGGVPLEPFAYLNEVIGRSLWGEVAVGSVSMQDSFMLAEWASPAQRERYLASLVAGDVYPAIGMTEPEVAGSDPTLIQTTAELADGYWTINGHKWFTSGASNCAFVTVFCRTESDDAPRHRRFSSIIVPFDTPGLEIVRDVRTMGGTGGRHGELRFTDVRVPADHLLGPRGEGFLITQKRLGPGRIFHCMRWLGQAQRAFELMCDRANTRYAHGSLLAEKGEIQRYVAESAADIQAARLLTMDTARKIDQGQDARVEISIIKFRVAQVLHDVVDRSIQVHGALGVTGDLPLERLYREARYARILDGPDEVHRMVVARRVLRDQSLVPWSLGASGGEGAWSFGVRAPLQVTSR